VYEGWQQAPISHHIALVMNPDLSPMDNPEIHTIIQQALNPQALVDIIGIPGLITANNNALPTAELRNQLANLGYPDGFRLTLAAQALPARELVLQQLNAIHLDLTTIDIDSSQQAMDILQNNRAHLLLIRWTNDDQHHSWIEKVGSENLIDLYTLPISYVVAEGLTISFTENGWPIGSR
jgi:hypothetical protein